MEKDPNGLSAHTPGAKLDAGKSRPALVLGGFAPALLEVAGIGSAGASKYSPDGWKSVQNGIERYSDAAMRHWLAHQSETLDPDSGQRHLSHCAWNILAVLTLQIATEKMAQQPEPFSQEM